MVNKKRMLQPFILNVKPRKNSSNWLESYQLSHHVFENCSRRPFVKRDDHSVAIAGSSWLQLKNLNDLFTFSVVRRRCYCTAALCVTTQNSGGINWIPVKWGRGHTCAFSCRKKEWKSKKEIGTFSRNFFRVPLRHGMKYSRRIACWSTTRFHWTDIYLISSYVDSLYFSF